MTTGLSYLDKMIKVALDFTEDRKLSRDIAADIFADAQVLFDRCRERRGFSEKEFMSRAKQLLIVLGRLKYVLLGKPLADLEALMDALLTEVTKNPRKEDS